MSLPRYPEYKDSGFEWLGKVPAHWGVTSIKRFATLQRGYDLTDAERTEGRYPVVTSGGITGSHGSFMARGPGVVTGRYGSTGRLFFIEDDFWPHNTSLYVSDFHGNQPRFVWYSLQTVDFAAHSAKAAVPGIDRNDIHVLPVAVPPPDEQRAIINYLDNVTADVDALLAEQQRLVELLNEKRQAVISHAVTRGLNPDSPMKPAGVEWLGEVPAHWSVSRVKDLSTLITSGPRGWSERVGDAGELFIQSGDLNDSLKVEFESAKRVSVEDSTEASRSRLCDGDVVVCITGAKTGNVAVCVSVPAPAYVNQHLCLVRPNHEVLPLFIGIVLKSVVGQTHFELSQYGLKQGLSLEDVRDAPVLLPPIEEQAAIVSWLDAETTRIDALTAEAQRAIELLQERRAALISAAVTGQIDVRAIADRAAA